MSAYSIVYTTVDGLDDAKEIARTLVQSKLAACVNILNQGLAVYEWEGEIKEDAEYFLIIKTRRVQTDDVIRHIKSIHPYEIPAIFCIDVAHVDEGYRQWVDIQTS